MARPTTKTTRRSAADTKTSVKNQIDTPEKDAVDPPKPVLWYTPAFELLQYFQRAADQWTARYVVVITALVIRIAVGLGGWSGKGVAPMYGDFEAQRHWLELTTHLPIHQWYFYDLPYWGLDYPPLTAFHSWVLGKIGGAIDSLWFALDESRGIETIGVQTFMRYLSLVSEMVLYIPGILLAVNLIAKTFKVLRMDQIVVVLIMLSQPLLVLIDHGHFQYNSVMLGLFLCLVVELIKRRLVVALVWFVCCLNFKQMGLYYSPFIFTYILLQLELVTQLIMVGATVIGTQAVILIPFLLGEQPLSTLTQIVVRVFPFARGLFEDKVANFWCVLNVVIKYKTMFTAADLSKLALLATLALIIPINALLFYKLKLKRDQQTRIAAIVIGFTTTALGFFFFSYQVHEKLILLALIPATLLLAIDPALIDIVQWINNVGCFSMYPLLKRDELVLQYWVTVFMANWFVGAPRLKHHLWLWRLIMVGSYLAMIGYHVADATMAPPKQWPDLWVIINCGVAFVGFAVFYAWLHYRALQL